MDIIIWPLLGFAIGYIGGLTGVRRVFNWKSLIIAIVIGYAGVLMGIILHFMPEGVVSLFGIPIGGANWLFWGLTTRWTTIVAVYGPLNAWWIWFMIVHVVYVIPTVPAFYLGKKLYLALEIRGRT